MRGAGAFALVLVACGGDPRGSDTDPATGSSSAGSDATESTTRPMDDATSESSDESDPSTTDEGPGPDMPPPIVPGLRAEYWSDYLDRSLVRIEATLDVDWAAAAPDPTLPADRFSARWSGWLTAPQTGAFTIVTETDDGVRVWIDDVLVIDDWIPHFVTRNEAIVQLEANTPVALRVDYFEIDLDASASLRWSAEGLPEAPIPESALTTIEPPGDDDGPKPPYQNPVVAFDCPDPGVLAAPEAAMPGYYMVCTGGSFPVRFSRDLVRWSDTATAILPAGKPAWAANGFRNWAPELHAVGDGVIAYFTTVDAQDRLCIGAATADDPLGPYTESAGPLVQHDLGVIDATYYEADGVPWLIYKIDGNSQGQPTPIIARQLADDRLSFAPGSTEVTLISNNGGTWEGGVVEAQWFTEHDGMLYMFYSGNVYDHRYRTGVARAPAITGPWEKRGDPILSNNERWVGPGHGTVLHLEGVDYFFFHAWTNAGNGTNAPGPGRHGLIDRITWVDGWPTIHDGTPSRSLQPWPGTD
jgi:hypothetical protein